MKWFRRFVERLDRHTNMEVRSSIAKGWDQLPSGAGKSAKEQRTIWIKSAMDRLDSLCDDKTRNEIMVETCPHTYPKTRIKKMRAEFKRTGNLDDLIEVMRKDKSWGGGSFYDYPTREGNIVYVTKVPYDPKAFEKATTDEERRLAYCHCSLVKRSKEQISPTFCCCSGGWVKQLWEGILEQPVEVELTESLLKGDDRCTHAVHLPTGLL
ncbi:MAG: hypothetical protein JSW61_11855 [Candidatus Thorarchaeota archaeon]|nr:MAG: hypothetical protein JSW61_11855 [Candidatus Thorarchaeota archaeon]